MLRIVYAVLMVFGLVVASSGVDAAATIGSSLVFSERQDRDGDGCFAGTLSGGKFALSWNVANGGSPISGLYEKGYYRVMGQSSWTEMFEAVPYSMETLENRRRSVEVPSSPGCTAWQYRVELWRNGSLHTVIRAEGQQNEETPVQDGSPVVIPPSNDSFASGTVINISSGQAIGSNVDATLEAGEPSHAGNSGGRSVWWHWTAPFNGLVTFDTIGSGFETVLAAYTGITVNNLGLVASNDDYGVGSTSRIQFNARGGVTYRIVVDGYLGSTGAIILNWTLLPAVAPLVTTQPQDRVATLGTTTSFGVSASGSQPMSFQWFRNGASILGATNSTLIVASVQFSDAGTYRVRITNPGGVVESLPAVLTVLPVALPRLLAQPVSVTVVVSQTARFSASVADALSFRWQYRISSSGEWIDLFNSAEVSGASTPELELRGVQRQASGTQYRLTAANAGGRVESAPATLTVTDPPTPVITRQPANASSMSGGGATFSIEVQFQGASPAYRWQRMGSGESVWSDVFNTAPYSGASSPTLSIAPVTLANNGDTYRVRITNPGGSVDSDAATVTVGGPLVWDAPVRIADSLRLSFNALPGRRYRIDAANDLSGPFTTLTEIATQAGGTLLLDPIVGSGRLYRVSPLP